MDKTKRRILIVDDQEPNRALIQDMLAPLEQKVLQAGDGREALALTGNHKVDIVLLDAVMPGLDGFEVAKRLKQDPATQMIPIVMITALDGMDDRIKALEAGADDFLSKPMHIPELLARVRNLLKVKAYNDHMQGYRQELEAEVSKRTQELSEAVRKLRIASLDTINRLATAAEYKDEETGAHNTRMSHYAASIAHKMGVDRKSAERILYASQLHDIGKIGVPDHILLKPGRLNPEEWVIMKRHTVIGTGILTKSDSDIIRTGESIALTHHEKWDGSGYPRGLSRSEIPLEGRITAIADVFDALTSKRPYRGPLSIAKSLDIITKGCGSHFDPAVVDAFFAIEKEILAIREKFQDVKKSGRLEMYTVPGPGTARHVSVPKTRLIEKDRAVRLFSAPAP